MKTVARLRWPLLLFIVAIVALGINSLSAHGDDAAVPQHDHLHHRHFAEFERVPEKARARRNPLEGDPDSIPAGRKLFAQHCAECHGDTGEGGRKAPSLRAEEVQRATPGTLFWILTNGVLRRGMPVWSKLPEAERWQIITYIESLPPAAAAETHVEHDQMHATPKRKLP